MLKQSVLIALLIAVAISQAAEGSSDT
jgi:hypothetical protein